MRPRDRPIYYPPLYPPLTTPMMVIKVTMTTLMIREMVVVQPMPRLPNVRPQAQTPGAQLSPTMLGVEACKTPGLPNSRSALTIEKRIATITASPTRGTPMD